MRVKLADYARTMPAFGDTVIVGLTSYAVERAEPYGTLQLKGLRYPDRLRLDHDQVAQLIWSRMRSVWVLTGDG